MTAYLLSLCLAAATAGTAWGGELESVTSSAENEILAEIEREEAERRAEKERALLGVLYTRMLGDFRDNFENASVFYFCLDGGDYVAASDGALTKVYLPRMTKSGEYFLLEEEADGDIASRITGMLDEEHASSTEEFWNHIALGEKPEEKPAIPHPVDINGVMLVPYFHQGAGYFVDGEWTCTDWPSTTFYNGRTLQQVGCGFTAAAMAVSYCTQQMIPPTALMGLPDYNGNGADGTVGVHAAELYEVPAYQTGDFGTAIEELRNGHPVMVHVGPSVFTTGGHYILLVGILPDGTVAVNDPGKSYNTYYYCGVTFSPSTIQSAAVGGACYTIFG